MFKSAALILNDGINTVNNLTLTDGSSLSVLAAAMIIFTTRGAIGERGGPVGLQPQLMVAGNISTLSSADKVQINARSNISGLLDVSDASNIIFNQGGEMSTATINVVTSTSSVILGGYSSRLSAYDAFDIRLSHRVLSAEIYQTDTITFQLARHQHKH